MKYKTYKNMEKVTKMIADKGYDWDEANQMAINIFDSYNPEGMSIESHISRILPKDEWVNQVNEMYQ